MWSRWWWWSEGRDDDVERNECVSGGMYGQVRSGRRIGRWGGEAESRQRRFLVCRRANPVPVVVAPSPILRFQTREGALARAHAHCNQGASLSLGMSSAQRSWRQERVKVNKVNKSGAPDCSTLLVRWGQREQVDLLLLYYRTCTVPPTLAALIWF